VDNVCERVASTINCDSAIDGIRVVICVVSDEIVRRGGVLTSCVDK